MAKQYYTLVAGLVEYTLESDRKGFDAPALRDEISAELSPGDRQTVRLFYAYYDVTNLISALNGKNTFNALGNLTPEEIAEEIAMKPAETDGPFVSKLPVPVAAALRAYRGPEDEETDPEDENRIDTGRPLEAALWEAYYAACAESPCRFLRQWYAFDNTLRNITTAYIAREKHLPIAEQLVGRDEVTEALSRSSAADFGLRNEIEYLEQVVALLDMKNIIEKEHQLDLIRWKKADELSTFNYFDINLILAYLAKVNIIHRWVALDPVRGREMFDALIAELTDGEALKRAETQALEK